MLVEFSFGNFRSFRDRTTLSMVAASKLHSDPELDSGNVFPARQRPRLNLLRVAALYGANASGKSNVAAALELFLHAVKNSANTDYVFLGTPFLLNLDTASAATFFEIIFLRGKTQYRYGFEIKVGTHVTPMSIDSEWLYSATGASETRLFERNGSDIELGTRFRSGAPLLKNQAIRRTGALFLSLVAQLGDDAASELVEYLSSGFNVVNGLDDKKLYRKSVDCLLNGQFRDEVVRLIRESDVGIRDVAVMSKEKIEAFEQVCGLIGSPLNLSDNANQDLLKRIQLEANHPVFNKDGAEVGQLAFPIGMMESQGTQKLIAYAAPILTAIQNGAVLFVDEMDARFHPLLTQALVCLFQSSVSNPRNAQLVFITHDTNVIGCSEFRRDQIWFVEKDRFGASHLYSLAEFKGVRKDDSYAEDYIRGRFGAIPFLGGLKRLLSNGLSDEAAGEEKQAAATTEIEGIHAST